MDIQNRPPWMWRGLNASGVAGLGVRFGMLSPGPGDLIGGFRKTLGFNTKMLQFWTIWGYHHEHLSCMMLYMGKCIGENDHETLWIYGISTSKKDRTVENLWRYVWNMIAKQPPETLIKLGHLFWCVNGMCPIGQWLKTWYSPWWFP